MKTWSFRDLQTSEWTGRMYRGPEDGLQINTPAGCEAVEGEHLPPPVDQVDGRRELLEQIHNAEALQARAVREALLELLPPEKGARLRAIEASIAGMRKNLKP